jgi:hypothetical protein
MNIGAKLEHFKKLHGNLLFYQNKCHHGNAPDTRRPCAKATHVWASGWLADQTPWPASTTLQPPVCFHGGDAIQEAVERNLRPRVGGGHGPWPDGHMSRPVGQHLVNYRLNQGSNCSCDSYKYTPTYGIQNTTLYLQFSTCKGSD